MSESAVKVAKALRTTKKKLQQIEHLVERQKTGKTPTKEERVNVTLKATLINQMAKIQARAAA